jgi:hypothetical protein
MKGIKMETKVISVYRPQTSSNQSVVVTARCAEWRANKAGNAKAAKTYRLVGPDGVQQGKDRYRTIGAAIAASAALVKSGSGPLIIDLA